MTPERVAPAEFAACVAERAQRLLHLARVGGDVLAFYDGPKGEAGAVCASAGERPTRPSAAGFPAALLAEARLERDGVVWSGSPPPAAVLGRGVFTFPLGPVRGAVAESAGWRLEVMGDEVLGLNLRFGYKPRRLEAALGQAEPGPGVELAERITGTSPVAHATAYAMAVEAARGIVPPAEVTYWRAILAELERLYSHIGDLAALAGSTGLPAAAAELYILKEDVLRLCGRLTGHRYQRGVVAVGGLRRRPERLADLPAVVRDVGDRVAAVAAALDRSTSFLDRLHGTGPIPAAMGAVGPVGRAGGAPYDTRHDRPYGLYAAAGAPERASAAAADSWGRYRVRVREVAASAAWLLHRWEAGPLESPATPPAPGPVQAARVEAPRGELIYFLGPGWVRVRTASAANWPAVAPAVAAGGVLQDVPIIEASFSLSVSAFDR